VHTTEFVERPKIAPMPPVQKIADLHGSQIHRAQSAADARAVHHRGEKRPAFVLAHLAFRLETPHLLIERVE
jgi:hypothetical protein